MMNVYKKIAVASICFAGGITIQASNAQMQLASALELALLLPKKARKNAEELNKMATDLAEKNAKRKAFDALSKNATNKKMTRAEEKAITYFITTHLDINDDDVDNIYLETHASKEYLIDNLLKLPESFELQFKNNKYKFTRDQLINKLTESLIDSVTWDESVTWARKTNNNNENDLVFSQDLAKNKQLLEKLNYLISLNKDLTIPMITQDGSFVDIAAGTLKAALNKKIQEQEKQEQEKQEQKKDSAAKKIQDAYRKHAKEKAREDALEIIKANVSLDENDDNDYIVYKGSLENVLTALNKLPKDTIISLKSKDGSSSQEILAQTLYINLASQEEKKPQAPKAPKKAPYIPDVD